MADQFQWLRTEPLSRRAATTPDRTALIDATPGQADHADPREWSYRNLDTLADATAAELADRVPAENADTRVGLAVSPRVEFVATLYASLRLGWTVAPLSPEMTGAELDQRVDLIDPAVLVCEHASEPLCRQADRRLVSVDRSQSPGTATLSATRNAVPGASGGDGQGPAQTGSVDGRSRPGRPADNGPGTTERRAALLLFTSGTTGTPKAVRLTMHNLLASAIGSAFRLGVTPSDRWLGCLPVHHMGGLAPVFRSVFYGTTLVLQGGFEASETARLLDAHGASGVSLVPTQLERLLDTEWSPSPALRTVLLGGAPAREPLLERATEVGVPVCPTYGLTETASQVTTARPGEASEHPAAVGQPLACTTVRVVVDGSPVGPGERGEIVVAGPTVTPGYLDEDATRRSFSEWGFHTGDVGSLDENGRLRVTGRLDDLLLSGGELVAPVEVAATLESHPAVGAAAVVGIDDPEWGERVSALVVSDDGGAPDVEIIRDHCRAELSPHKIPKTIVVGDGLPRTDSGTIDREAVAGEIRQRRHEEGTGME